MVLAAGLAVGVLGALGVTRLLRGLLYQVSPVDPLAFAAAVVVIALAVIGASLRPASRAANVDPLTSIRSD